MAEETYPKPAPFYWSNIGRDGIIQQTLTASEWNKFLGVADQYLNWKNKNGNSNLASAYRASPGDVITANIYNGPARALGVATVRGGPEGEVITAARFAALSAAVR